MQDHRLRNLGLNLANRVEGSVTLELLRFVSDPAKLGALRKDRRRRYRLNLLVLLRPLDYGDNPPV